MKFKVNSKNLEKLLVSVLPAVPQRTPMMILENFLFEIEEGNLKVTSTDMEIVLSSSISVDADEDAKMIIPAKLLHDIVRSLGDTVINFETTENDKLLLKTDSGEYSVGYAGADEFPKIPEVEDKKEISLEGAYLSRALEKTSFAISKEAMRPAMMGTLFEFTSDGLKFVATDGHRLVKLINKSKQFDSFEQLVVPERAISVLTKIVGEGEVKIHIGDSNIAFLLDDISLVSRLIGQKYPDYNSVIPIDNENRVKVNRSRLLSGIKRMLLFASSNYQQVKLAITKDQLTLSAEDVDRGSSGKEVIECELKGDPMDIGFNTTYLNDMVAHLDSEELEFELNSPTKAAILKPVNGEKEKEGEELMMLLMPVRLNS